MVKELDDAIVCPVKRAIQTENVMFVSGRTVYLDGDSGPKLVKLPNNALMEMNLRS